MRPAPVIVCARRDGMTEILRQLGRYELLRRIAAGGMGEIFLAKMRGAGGFEKRIIIKTILPHLAEEEEFITKFLDEGRIVVQLTHGNIVPVFDMGEQNGEHFIAMEYIPGRDLREVIKRLQIDGETMPVEMALFLISEVCKGLDYAHRKVSVEDGHPLELVHRDVSPSNILLSSEGEIKVIDFGIARATNKLSRTVSGRIQGKFCYMSPEQASGKIVDGRSDIFSTGVVLYELLTGMRPFEGPTDLGSIDLVRKCEYDPPSTLNPQVPEEVDEIIASAMALDLDARYQSIDRMQTDILQYLYSNACAPTSQQLADYLKRIFPEGIEREDLRATTGSRSGRSQPPKKMSLDDILDQELDVLAGKAPTPIKQINALTSTAPSAALDAAPAHTATLITDATFDKPNLRDLPPGQTAEEFVLADGEDEPVEPLLAVGEEDEEQSFKGEDEEPEGEEGEEDEVTGEESDSSSAEEEEDASPARAEPLAVLTRAEPPRSKGVMIAVGIVIAIVVAAVALFTWSNRRGQVRIETNPAGARIFVDGAQLSGAITPYTLELEPGPHTFALEKEGFARTQRFRLDVKAGKTHLLEGAEIALLEDKPSKPPTREVLVKTDPTGAKLSVDGQELGTSPHAVELGTDVRVIYARKEGCEEESYLISKNFRHDELTIRLECDRVANNDTRAETTPSETSAETTPGRKLPTNRKLRVTLRAKPSDALITIDDRRSVRGLFTGRFDPDEVFKVRVHREGYKAIERTVTPGKLRSGTLTFDLEKIEMGCLNVRVFQPQVADLSIDGKLVGKQISRLEDHPLSAGRHTVRAINALASRNESYKVEISPGKKCAHLTVFPAE